MSTILRSTAVYSHRLAAQSLRTYATKATTPKVSEPPPKHIESQNVPAEPTIDSTTSFYSPMNLVVPEDHIRDDVIPAGAISGAPIDLQTRTVRIYKPSKAATQSSNAKGRMWRMDWDILGRGHRWENPLMGWQSSADYVQGTHMSFRTKEDAIYFAEKQGYDYFVQEPKEREIKPKAYASNYSYSPKKLKNVHTK